MLGERRLRLVLAAPTLLGLEAAGDDVHARLVQEESASDVRGLRRHRVGDALEHDFCSGPDEDGNAQREIFRKHFDRPKSHELLAAPNFRNHFGGSIWGDFVLLDVTRVELSLKIERVLELAVFEEGALHPTDEALDGALLISATRCAHLDSDTDVDDGLSEGRIEGLDVTPNAGFGDDGQRQRLVLPILVAIPSMLPAVIYHLAWSSSINCREFVLRVWQVAQHRPCGAASEYPDGGARCRKRCRARQPEHGQIAGHPTNRDG